jgi:6-pyruvoyl-tetrahydropterin synthase
MASGEIANLVLAGPTGVGKTHLAAAVANAIDATLSGEYRERLASAENLAVFCWDQLAPHIPRGRLVRLRLWETPRNYVDYEGP